MNRSERRSVMKLMDGDAWCSNCGWKTNGRNSMGNAAKHHKKNNHFVHVELRYEWGELPREQLSEVINVPKLYTQGKIL